MYGRVAGDLRVLARLAQDLRDRVGERVERLLRLRLGRLDEQRLVDEQREVDRRRVVAVVEQPLGEVERLDLQLALHRRAGQARTRACRASRRRAAAGRRRRLAQPREQVVRVEHRGLGRVLQPLGAERADVRVGAHERPVVALEAAQAADRLRLVGRQVEGRLVPFRRRRCARSAGSSGTARCGRTPRSGPQPGPPPPCGCVNVLCRLKWTMSKPMSPGRVRPMTALRFAPS